MTHDCGSARDEQKRLLQQLREREAHTRAVLEKAGEGIVTLNERGVLESFNEVASQIFGYQPTEVVGRDMSMLLAPSEAPPHSEHLDFVWARELADTRETRVLQGRRRDGSGFPLQLTVNDVRIGAQRTFVAIVRDLTERVRSEEKIRNLALYDDLTKLPNRQHFLERMKVAMESAKRHGRVMSLLFLDLNGFKQVNDSLGHNAGDRLLRIVANRLIESLRSTDAVGRVEASDSRASVSRLGGDEFTILLTELSDASKAAQVSRRLLDVLSRPVELGSHEISVSASVGIALYPDDGEDVETLIRNADMAMYTAKKEKSGFRFFETAMHAAANRRFALESALDLALERGEFSVYYQPVCRSSGGEIVGAEALLRWSSPDFGVVEPVEFLAIAEETGSIVPIGEWVLRVAGAQARSWQDAGFPSIHMSVNLSASQLRHERLAETVTRILCENRLVPAQLQLEVSERTLMLMDEATSLACEELTDVGVGLVLDGFCAGNSSLACLRHFPVTRLKLDRTFVRCLTDNSADASFSNAIITMAHELGVQVVAAGIETPDQASLLRQQGCDALQGFLFGAPVPALDFERFLTT